MLKVNCSTPSTINPIHTLSSLGIGQNSDHIQKESSLTSCEDGKCGTAPTCCERFTSWFKEAWNYLLSLLGCKKDGEKKIEEPAKNLVGQWFADPRKAEESLKSNPKKFIQDFVDTCLKAPDETALILKQQMNATLTHADDHIGEVTKPCPGCQPIFLIQRLGERIPLSWFYTNLKPSDTPVATFLQRDLQMDAETADALCKEISNGLSTRKEEWLRAASIISKTMALFRQ